MGTHFVQEICTLDELGSEGVLTPVHLKISGESFRQEVVPLHHLVKHLVSLDGWLDVPLEDLKARPEGQQGVHEVL